MLSPATRTAASTAVLLTTALILGLPSQAQATPPADPGRFLRFFNDVGKSYSESHSTAAAYYRAIDPNDVKTTLDDFMSVHKFDTAADRVNAI